MVPKFFSAAQAASTGASGDNIAEALLQCLADSEANELVESPSKQDLELGPSPSAGSPLKLKPDQLVKVMLANDSRSKALHSKVHELIAHDSPIRAHMLFAKFRSIMLPAIKNISCDGCAGKEMLEGTVGIFADVIARIVFDPNLFRPDWVLFFSEVQANVTSGQAPD